LNLRLAANRFCASIVNDKRVYPEFSWRWLNQFAGKLFWENAGAAIRPQFAWGIVLASAQARALGHKEVAALEFGVAGGRGLVAMQDIARTVSTVTGVAIQLYGFDMSTGLPEVTDPRDLPQLYRPGDYRMDLNALKARLDPGTRLIIGDIKHTIDEFLSSTHAPVGFVSFDMDLYTSTRDSMKLFRGDFAMTQCLPRVVCYFDDIMGTTFGDLNGERLAMAEYNREYAPHRGISSIYGLRYQAGWPHSHSQWPDMMFWAHFLDHPNYGVFDGLALQAQAPLEG
jgi:hypothetical protein